MPETAIGLFPDVGSMFWMTRLLTRPMANYLGLTGKRLNASDLIHTGLATHYVPSKHLMDLEMALIDVTSTFDIPADDSVVASVLSYFHVETTLDDESSFLVKNKESIEASFSAVSVEEIVTNLEVDNSEFGQKTIQTIHKMSPTSLKLTLEGLKRGAACETIAQALQMEYRMATACATRKDSDFFEGVRAVLVDKDQDPKWNPDSIDCVTEEMIESFFAPIDDELIIPGVPQPSKL